jgi:hypothetical protein
LSAQSQSAAPLQPQLGTAIIRTITIITAITRTTVISTPITHITIITIIIIGTAGTTGISAGRWHNSKAASMQLVG